MGCDYYALNGKVNAHFPDSDDSVSCLCTFPHNYRKHPLEADTVRSLAYLGAALVLAHQQEIECYDDGYYFLPKDLPAWIKEGIDKVVAK